MKKISIAIYSIFVLALISCGQASEHKVDLKLKGIVHGIEIKSDADESYGAILEMRIKDVYFCSASHLGNGFILTAWHCIGEKIQKYGGRKPSLRFKNVHDERIGPIEKEDYEVFYPKTVITETVGSSPLRQPDLALIQVKGKFAESLRSLPTVRLSKKGLVADEKDVKIAGFGRDGFNGHGSHGVLRVGEASLIEVRGLFYWLQYSHIKNVEKYSSASNGDSGGPIFKHDSDGNIVLHGVSTVIVYTKENLAADEVSIVHNRYVRLDTEAIRSWLEKFVPY